MEPKIARPKPYLVTLRAGRSYFWCRCGLSKKQPFCDGSHAGTGFEPLKYTAQMDGEEVLFCGCKYTQTAPFCDGAHTNLPGGSPQDDPYSPANVGIPMVPASPSDPRTMLDGGCYVFSPSRAQLLSAGSLRYCEAISGNLGAQYQTTLYVQAGAGTSPAMRLPDREVIVFVSAGAGAVVISGRRFDIAGSDGVYVRPGEAFQFENADAATPIEAFITACPAGPVEWLDEMPHDFDAAYRTRIVSVDPNQRTAMGPRYFQCLVDKSIGSNVITQFIGHIPQSKAAPHRHLYEESIIVLCGVGCMWTESGKASVRAGDVIFLPRKQAHSLESLNSEGLDVVGVICPGDNPSINY